VSYTEGEWAGATDGINQTGYARSRGTLMKEASASRNKGDGGESKEKSAKGGQTRGQEHFRSGEAAV